MKKYVSEEMLVDYVTEEELENKIPEIVQEVINQLAIWDGGAY